MDLISFSAIISADEIESAIPTTATVRLPASTSLPFCISTDA